MKPTREQFKRGVIVRRHKAHASKVDMGGGPQSFPRSNRTPPAVGVVRITAESIDELVRDTLAAKSFHFEMPGLQALLEKREREHDEFMARWGQSTDRAFATCGDTIKINKVAPWALAPKSEGET